MQRRRRGLALLLELVPAPLHAPPQERGEEEGGRDGLVLAQAIVGRLEGRQGEGAGRGILERVVEQRQQAVVQLQVAKPLHARHRVAGEQHLEDFLEEPRLRDVLEEVLQFRDGRGGLRVDREPELRREAGRAQHAHRVLAEARGGVADRHELPRDEVLHAVLVVPDLLLHRVVEERVHGEVAAHGVFRLRAEDVVGEHAAVHVLLVALVVGFRVLGGEVRPVGGHLHRLRAPHHVHDLEAPADDARAPEERTHRVGMGAGGHVEVLGPHAEDQVAHRAPHHERRVARALQLLAGLAGAAADVVLADVVLVGTVDDGLRRVRDLLGAPAEDPRDERLDHARNLRMCQPRSRAWLSSVGSGSTATGFETRSSSGRSLCESL